jgi:hypothetical protein
VVRSSQQTIQSSLRQHRIGKQGIPILGWAITGDDDRAGARAFTDQLVQVIRLLARVLAHGEVVQDQQRWQQIVAQPTVPGAVGMPAAEIAQQPAGLDELDPVALPSCLMAKTFGEMRFADSRR